MFIKTLHLLFHTLVYVATTAFFSRKYLYSLIYRALKYMQMMKQSMEEPSLTRFHFILFMFDTKFVRVSLFPAEVVVVEMSFNDDAFVERTEDTGKE